MGYSRTTEKLEAELSSLQVGPNSSLDARVQSRSNLLPPLRETDVLERAKERSIPGFVLRKQRMIESAKDRVHSLNGKSPLSADQTDDNE